MKKFLALAAMLVIGSVQAEELKFGDLNYFLKQGQFNVGVDAIVHNETVRSAGVDQDMDGYIFQSHFGYAVLNNLNVTFGVDYILEGETEPKAGPSSNVNGFQNPKIGANYRVVNQDTAGVNIDLGAVATFKVLDRKVNGGSTEGNTFSPILSRLGDPRNTLDVAARVGKKWNEANEFQFTAGVLYHTDGEYDQKGPASKNGVDVDSSLDFKLGANYQYRPVHEFMMNFGISAIRYAEYKIDGNELSDHIDYTLSFDAKYLVTETTIAKFIFTHQNNSEFDVAGVDVDQRQGQQYGFGVDFLF